MISRAIGLASLAVALLAAVLVLAVPAGAGSQAGAQFVFGTDGVEGVKGSLVGKITDTPDTFASFFATRRLTRSGILTWRAPVVFDGCLDGVCGKLYLDGHYFYRFKPGTKYYDFELGGDQPGTTGDPGVWISGGSVVLVTGGEGGFKRASGILVLTETVFLTERTYRGIVRI